jgi:PAS domain S-box-containing protein
MALTHAAEAGWEDDPAYETFGLETYIGGKVLAGGELYGTLCFAADDPREEPFNEFERTFIRLLAGWAGYEIDRRSAQEDLREEQQRLELALTGTNTGLAEWNIETDAVTWDETLVDIVGRDVETIEEFEEVVHPDDRDQVRRELTTMTDGEGPWIGEFRVLDGDGDVIWLRTQTVVDDSGAPRRVIAMATDVTKKMVRKRRLEALYEATQRLFAVQTRDEALEVGAQTLEDALGLTVAGFYESVGDALVRATGSGTGPVDPPERVERGNSPLWEAMESESPIVYNDVAKINDGVDRGAVSSAGYFPIGDHGVVAIGTTDSGRLHEEERQLIEVLVANLASVLDTTDRQRALVEERERFRLLVESVDEYAFVVLDEEGAIQAWNEGAANLFGYEEETAVGMAMADLHPPTNRRSGRPERLLQQARIAGESADEGWRVRADGSEFYADVRYAPLGHDDEVSRGYAVIVRDMTERRLQRRRTERFVEEADDVVTVLDTEGTITYASGSAERVLGYDPSDLVGENLFDYLHPDSREHAMETFFESVNESINSRVECRFRSPDGQWRTVEGRCRNMLGDEAVDGILVYLRDVTESKQRARRFESIFNQTFQFTGLLTLNGTVVEANQATGELAGVTPADLVGEAFDEAPLWSHSAAASENVKRIINRAATGEFARDEIQARGPHGFATVDFSAKPIYDQDGDVSLLVVEGRDITARQQQRRTLRVMQRVMRHNMRNDLTKLRGWTEMLQTEADAESRAEYAATIQQILDKWDAMTQKMTEIRQALRRRQGRQARAEVTDVVENVAATARDDSFGATVKTETPADASRTVSSKLSIAIEELVKNAVATTDTPTVTVGVSMIETDWVEVRVCDDGPGMPEIEAEVLETGEESPLRHGDGLGLWMVRTVVTQIGGEVSVDTGDDGTTVSLRVPTEPSGDQLAIRAGE